MKARINQVEMMADIVRDGYIIPSSWWTIGSGRYITSRAIPPNFQKVTVAEMESLISSKKVGGIVAKNFKKLMNSNPRTRSIIYCNNVRATNKELKRL